MLTPTTILQNRYRIIKQLGQGGMGTVYEAIDQRFDSQVAIKETHFNDEVLRKQFEREARLLNRLRHPAMTRVIDHFSENDGQFLVMDFVAGEELWEMLQKQGGAFPVDKVMGWADQLLDALNYLHKQDPPIIHRDIKPQNLKLSDTGQIILLDFGLAKGFVGQISRVTTSGSIFGYTPNYAPLEQIQGTGTDARTDLYSLAATLYHLLTGVVPPDVLTRLTATTEGQFDPLRPANELNHSLSPSIAVALNQAMAIARSQRFGSAVEMREALGSPYKPIEPITKTDSKLAALPSTIISSASTSEAQEQESESLSPTMAKTIQPSQVQPSSPTIASHTIASPTLSSSVDSSELVPSIKVTRTSASRFQLSSAKWFALIGGSLLLLTIGWFAISIIINRPHNGNINTNSGGNVSSNINASSVNNGNSDTPSSATTATASPVNPQSPRGRAELILSKARAGENFAELVRGYTEDPKTVAKGGDLGWFERGQTGLDQNLENILFSLESGDVSDIIETPRSFDIYKVEEHYSEGKGRIHLRVLKIMKGV